MQHRLRFEVLESRQLLDAGGLEALADPLVSIPEDLQGAPSQVVVAPVNIDDADGVRAAEIHIQYDTALLDAENGGVRPGSVWPETNTSLLPNVDDATGTIVVWVFGVEPLDPGAGSLVEIDFTIAGDACEGQAEPSIETQLALTQVILNEGAIPAQTSDGLITILCNAYPPQANPDSIALDEGASTTVLDGGATSVLDNDTDPDLPNDSLVVSAVNGAPANVGHPVSLSAGTLTLQADGTFSYAHDGTEVFTDSFEYTIQDEAGHSSTTTVAITVNALNDAPLLQLPLRQTTDINTPLVLSEVGGNSVRVDDADAGDGQIEVTLNATSGLLSLHATIGLTFTDGDGTDDASMTFAGTLANINAALDGMIFSPTEDFEDTATVAITVDDRGHSGAGNPQQAGGQVLIDVGRSARLSGFVYADTNNNNQPDAHEGVPGVKITLTGEGIAQETWTDDNGRYEFHGLLGGTYQITQRHSAAFLEGSATTITDIVLGTGEVKANNHFRELHLRPECIPNRFLATTTQPADSDPWTELVRKVVGDTEVRSGNTTDPRPPAKSREIVEDAREVTVYGTNGNDTFEFVADTDNHTVKINGELHEFDPARFGKIVLDGRLGRDSAQVVGTAGKDIATLSPTFGTVNGVNYDLRLSAFEQIQVDGVSGSDDLGTLLDSFSDDRLTAAQNTATLSGYYFSNQLTNFATVVAKSQTGGHDVLNEQTHEFVLTTQGHFNAQSASAPAASQYIEATKVEGNVAQQGSALPQAVLREDREAAVAASKSDDVPLAEAELKPIVAEAIARWDVAGFVPEVVSGLRSVEFAVADLPGAYLGAATGTKVEIDRDAAGYGWFVDATPDRDEEFVPVAGSQELHAVSPKAKSGVDLLTVVAHELGHVAGLADRPSGTADVMSGQLATGVRRVAALEADTAAPVEVQSPQGILPARAESPQFDLAPTASTVAAAKWNVVGTSALAVQPHTGDQNVIRVLETDTPLPVNVEFRVTFHPKNADRSSNTNALIVFDYKSPTDFKYAGAFVSINRWAIGRMTERGYTIEKIVPGEFQSGTDYRMALRIEDTTITLTTDGIDKLSHTFPEPMQHGRLGLLSWSDTSEFDDFAVMEI